MVVVVVVDCKRVRRKPSLHGSSKDDHRESQKRPPLLPVKERQEQTIYKRRKAVLRTTTETHKNARHTARHCWSNVASSSARAMTLKRAAKHVAASQEGCVRRVHSLVVEKTLKKRRLSFELTTLPSLTTADSRPATVSRSKSERNGMQHANIYMYSRIYMYVYIFVGSPLLDEP
jgi:hypothetical protein